MDFLHKTAKERNRFTEKCKIKVTQTTHFFAKFKCREICEPQNREINVPQKISCNKLVDSLLEKSIKPTKDHNNLSQL